MRRTIRHIVSQAVGGGLAGALLMLAVAATFTVVGENKLATELLQSALGIAALSGVVDIATDVFIKFI